MTTDFRALCAELIEAIDHFPGWIPPSKRPAIERARAAYAICERERLHQSTRAADLEVERQALVPVPVAERPWEREGWCDELGRCWWGRLDTGDWSTDWTLATPEAIAEFCEFSPQTVCLPAHALPLPEVGE